VDYLCHNFPHIINWRDKHGKTALMLAAQSSDPARAPSSTFHLPPNARPRALSAGTTTASEDTTTISTLISHNASVTCVDNVGNTALHHASSWGNLKAIRVLLSAGALPLVLNKANHTPLDYSVTKQTAQYFQSIVSDLERRKMDKQQAKRMKLNTVRAMAAEEHPGTISPVSPTRAMAKDTFGNVSSPSKITGGVRLVVDMEIDESAACIDDNVSNGIQLTARKMGRASADEQLSVSILNGEAT
jgi:ankyrin repeat protein